MPLTYDFDLVTTDRGRYAVFRDPATQEAVRGADERVQAYFVAAGFMLRTPEASYDAGADSAARLEIVEALAREIEQYDLGQLDTNGFDFEAFMTHLEGLAPQHTLAGFVAAPFESARNAAVGGIAAMAMATLVVWQGSAMMGLELTGEGYASLLHSLTGGGE